VDAALIAASFEGIQFALQVKPVPEKHVVDTRGGSCHQPFDNRVR
jgi:hypothetical protein